MRILKKRLIGSLAWGIAIARAQQPLTEEDATAWLDGYMPYAGQRPWPAKVWSIVLVLSGF